MVIRYWQRILLDLCKVLEHFTSININELFISFLNHYPEWTSLFIVIIAFATYRLIQSTYTVVVIIRLKTTDVYGHLTIAHCFYPSFITTSGIANTTRQYQQRHNIMLRFQGLVQVGDCADCHHLHCHSIHDCIAMPHYDYHISIRLCR